MPEQRDCRYRHQQRQRTVADRGRAPPAGEGADARGESARHQFIALAAVVSTVWIAGPRVFSAPTITTESSATRSPYSTSVTPRRFRVRRQKRGGRRGS